MVMNVVILILFAVCVRQESRILLVLQVAIVSAT